VIAEAQQDHLAVGERFGLIDRVAVAFLFVLHRERHARREIAHAARFRQQ